MKNLIVLIMACCVFSGCQFFAKKPPQLYSFNNSDSSHTEKVWVEAETRKIWVNPHVDDNGDMVAGHYKYVVITPGHWAVKGE